MQTGTALQVMASLRTTVLNRHRLTGADNIAEACRVTAFSADRGLDLLTDDRIGGPQACWSQRRSPGGQYHPVVFIVVQADRKSLPQFTFSCLVFEPRGQARFNQVQLGF